MYGNVFLGAKVHTIVKILKIHVAYSLFSEKAFIKISIFFGYIWTQKEKCDHFAHRVGGSIIVTNSPREQKKKKSMYVQF
jgi:hypothetical protein